MKKISIYIFKTITFVLMFILTFTILSYVHLSMIRSSDLKRQNKKLKSIENKYKEYQANGYYDFSLDNYDNKKLNEVKILASHNSYKKKGSIVGKLFVGLGDSFSEAKALNYSYNTLTKQLMDGIYSFELDLRYRRNNFEVTHVPIVDNSSNVVSFKNGLKEIKTFLMHEENSFPLIIILEIKNDYMWLDPFIKDIKEEEFIKLENLLKEELGSYLYTPKDMIEGYSSLTERINDKGWPKVSELKNKAMFVIHAGSYANNYLNLKENNEQILFSATYKTNLNDNAPFIIHNNLDIDSINELVNKNYIVRTRIGDTLNYSDEDVYKALKSNAQILTSDFTVARSDLNEYYYILDKYTIVGLNND